MCEIDDMTRERNFKQQLTACFGKPVAEIVPPTCLQDRASWIGSMKGKMEILGDIISPAADEGEWEALRD